MFECVTANRFNWNKFKLNSTTKPSESEISVFTCWLLIRTFGYFLQGTLCPNSPPLSGLQTGRWTPGGVKNLIIKLGSHFQHNSLSDFISFDRWAAFPWNRKDRYNIICIPRTCNLEKKAKLEFQKISPNKTNGSVTLKICKSCLITLKHKRLVFDL